MAEHMDKNQGATPEQAELLHHFSHDLRNRLAAIQQVLSQLSSTPAEEQAELIGFAEQQYFKAMRSTEDLLDGFHVERGVGALSLSNVDLTELLRASIDLMQHRFTRKGQTLHIDAGSSLTIKADKHWLNELITVLLSNASKFGTPGGVIRIRLSNEDNAAVLTVQDDGAGLDAEDLERIFVRYAWLKSRSTAGEAQGRGNLARAKQWAEAHGGVLQARSAGPDKGSTFELRLPIAH
ncbi:MAG: HAMP domain-containing histidine kinase [Flavobacteriales bacterium]|nr:HAMP domain-containing histidine kinase [Flavobacteriales bacterium]MCC6936596.1 HAMP domain-containing histidine kinase [Flavobacteriales bacterium]